MIRGARSSVASRVLRESAMSHTHSSGAASSWTRLQVQRDKGGLFVDHGKTRYRSGYVGNGGHAYDMSDGAMKEGDLVFARKHIDPEKPHPIAKFSNANGAIHWHIDNNVRRDNLTERPNGTSYDTEGKRSLEIEKDEQGLFVSVLPSFHKEGEPATIFEEPVIYRPGAVRGHEDLDMGSGSLRKGKQVKISIDDEIASIEHKGKNVSWHAEGPTRDEGLIKGQSPGIIQAFSNMMALGR